jgi:proteasome lid subunit RPN8/RPN11
MCRPKHTQVRLDVIDAVIAHAREAAPAECCGVLIGTERDVVEAVRTRNVADRPTRFEIDPKGHLDARRSARARGLDVVGFYHSHPHSPARPSETDTAEANYPDHLHLIVSLASDPPDTRVFWFDGRNFVEDSFVTVR